MRLCAAAGIPHSFFLGSPSIQWTDDDRAKAVAWDAYVRTSCPDCLMPNHANPDDYHADRDHCELCAKISRANEAIRMSPGSKHGTKVRWGYFPDWEDPNIRVREIIGPDDG